MPLERILGLEKVVDEEEVLREARKTWRAGAVKEDGKGLKVESWTTGEIMEGWALERGFCESSVSSGGERERTRGEESGTDFDASLSFLLFFSDRKSRTTRSESSWKP